jgi:ApbE superfamily uncharacterized protein (UPF0280 family)
MNINPLYKKRIEIEETKINLISDLTTYNDYHKDNKNNIGYFEGFIINQRREVKNYMKNNPMFAKTLEPYKNKETKNTDPIPKIIELMINGAKIANVGPTATLAGAIAEISLDYLIEQKSNYSIIENGGDIAFLNNYNKKKVVIGIYAGNSPLSGKIGFEFKFKKKNQKFGVCSSSASVGYSLSYGRSDCVTVIAHQASIADGLATSIGNAVNGKKNEDAIENSLITAEKFKEHYIGALIIVGKSIGTIGKLPKIIGKKI